MIKDGVAYGQAGAGIVYDSDPLSEYKETMTKMMGGLRAVFRAEAYGGVKVTIKTNAGFKIHHFAVVLHG